jgi:transposase-like protein
MSPDDRERIAELLQDPRLSYRAIGRELGISDWTIRKVARELDGDSRPMRQRRSHSDEIPPDEVSPVTGWLVFGGIVATIVLAIWAGSRWAPPPDL